MKRSRRDFEKGKAKLASAMAVFGSSPVLNSFSPKDNSMKILQVFIPMPIQVVIDNVGWWCGEYGSKRQEPYRTGISRNHVQGDYQAAVKAVVEWFPKKGRALVTGWFNTGSTFGLIVRAAAAHQAQASNIFTFVSDIYPKNAVGSMTGLAGFCGSMGGVIAASAVGFILEFTNRYLLIFSVAGSAYVFAWLFFKFSVKQIEPIISI